MMATNKFDQLVEDLDNGDLGFRHICNAIRQHIRNKYPKEYTDILCGKSEHNSGLIAIQFRLIREMIGSMELLYLRMKQEQK